MRVGADVQSVCRKCGDSWHVVIALAGGKIAKVECSECGARHGYRPPGPALRVPRGEPGGRGAAARKPARGRTVVEADPQRPPRPFAVSESYQVGDRVVHASFGEGVVQAIAGPSKVEVLFGVGPKILVHGRGKH